MEADILSEELFGFNLHRRVQRQLRDHFIPHKGNDHRPHVLRHRVLVLYSVLLVSLKVALVGLPALLPLSTLDSSAITAENILALTNQSRKDMQLPVLALNAQLTAAAQNKARDMMRQGYFAHFSPSGVSPWYWIVQAGYNYSSAGENLAIRFSTAEGVNDAWLASPTHRANILSRDFSEIGVAVLTDSFANQGVVTLVVQMFGTSAKASRTSPKAVKVAGNSQKSSQTVSPRPATPPQKPVTPQPPPEEPVAAGITFPLENSFVNTAEFQILGRAAAGQSVEISVDALPLITALASPRNEFSLRVPRSAKLKDGPHELRAVFTGVGRPESRAIVRFQLDTTPPEIFTDQFFMSPRLGGDSRSYDIRAGVAEDSIRTIVSVGEDSTALAKTAGTTWSGEITLYHRAPHQSLPIEIFAQDLAGNQSRLRVGTLNDGQVQSLYSFVSGAGAPKIFSAFGLTFNFADFEGLLKNFYLYFVAFLALALILKIAIARHVQHVKTVAGAAAVMILAMVMFLV